jgi:hypothetical protein
MVDSVVDRDCEETREKSVKEIELRREDEPNKKKYGNVNEANIYIYQRRYVNLVFALLVQCRITIFYCIIHVTLNDGAARLFSQLFHPLPRITHIKRVSSSSSHPQQTTNSSCLDEEKEAKD